MEQNLFEAFFLESFETYKVLQNLTTQETGRILPKAPKTIWQILNHLIVWQDYQLMQLEGIEKEVDIDDQLTWAEEEQCESQDRLDKAIAKIYYQLERFRVEVTKLDLRDSRLQRKIKLIQDSSVHLSIHLGELILMRRMTENYPLPHQMKAFLS